MSKTDADQAALRFTERLRSDYYATERSKNRADDYSEKESRDTEAVKDFIETTYFRHIEKMD